MDIYNASDPETQHHGHQGLARGSEILPPKLLCAKLREMGPEKASGVHCAPGLARLSPPTLVWVSAWPFRVSPGGREGGVGDTR